MGRSAIIFMADSGGGHRSAAVALKEAFEILEPGAWDVHFIDVFSLLPFPLNKSGGFYRPMVTYTPWLWSTLWRLAQRRWFLNFVFSFFTPLTRKPLLKLIEDYRPEIAISVHQFSNVIPVRVFRDGGWDGFFATVVTDLITTPMAWFYPGVDACFVPTPEAAEMAVRAGISPDKIHLKGFPVSPRFLPPEDKGAAKRALGLRDDMPVLLLMGGGEGMGRMFSVARAINQASLPVQLVIVTGRNAGLRRALERMDWRISCRIYGFVDFIPSLMQASDVVLTKAGPGTIYEAITVGVPLLLIDFVPGQESGNVDFVVDKGVGAFAPSPEKAVAVLREWLENPGVLEKMKDNAGKLANPRASLEIVSLILEKARRASNCGKAQGENPLLVVISGPSGAGKDSIIRRMKELGFPFHFVVTMTTRPPRPGEVNGRDYIFVSEEEFEDLLRRDGFLENAVVYGHRYGVPKEQIRKALESGKDVIMRVDVQGARTIRRLIPDAVFIFLVPSSEEELTRRLKARHTEDERTLKLRLETAREEMKSLGEFDYVVVNADGRLDEAVQKILAIITAEKCRTRPRKISL